MAVDAVLCPDGGRVNSGPEASCTKSQSECPAAAPEFRGEREHGSTEFRGGGSTRQHGIPGVRGAHSQTTEKFTFDTKFCGLSVRFWSIELCVNLGGLLVVSPRSRRAHL